MGVGFYTSSLVDGPNTTPYRHAKKIGEHTSENILITVRRPPNDILNLYEEVRVLKGSGIKGVISRTKAALTTVNHFLGPEDVLVTGLGYDSNLVGFLSDTRWIADLWDDPFQYIAENPDSMIHHIAAQGLFNILDYADVAFIIQHPESPLDSGKRRIYARNGAPVQKIKPGKKTPKNPLRGIVLGKTRLKDGMKTTLEGIRESDIDIIVDVYGKKHAGTISHAESLGIRNKIVFHGDCGYQTVCERVKKSHVGFCLLPPRRDWLYSYPLKVGEYLAAGTIPILTPHPGMTDLAGNVGKYCNSKTEVASTLEQIDILSKAELEEQIDKVRARAEEVPTIEEDQSLIDTVEKFL